MNGGLQVASGVDNFQSPPFRLLDAAAPAFAVTASPDPVVRQLASPPRQLASAPPKIQQPGNGVHRCGQCYDKKAADHFCQDCNEFFCWSCGAEMHRRGNRTLHRLFEVAKADSSQPGQLDLIKVPQSVVYYCDAHPSERVTCACKTCDMRTFCNICAISCAKRQHEVSTVSEMVQRLPDSINSLSTTVEEAMGASELQQAGVNAELTCYEREIMLSISNCRLKASNYVKLLQTFIDADEESYTHQINSIAAEVRREFERRTITLAPPPITYDECQEVVGGNMVLALNRYASLMNAIEMFEYRRHQTQVSSINDLQNQMRAGVRERLESISELQKITLQELEVFQPLSKESVQVGSTTHEASSAVEKKAMVEKKGRQLVGKHYDGASIRSRSLIRITRFKERGSAPS